MTRNKNQLEADFRAVEKEVNEKIKEAAKLLLEANEIAQTKGFKVSTTELYMANLDLAFDTAALESAMDDAGWNTSSWYC